jgi:hypothetical protein
MAPDETKTSDGSSSAGQQEGKDKGQSQSGGKDSGGSQVKDADSVFSPITKDAAEKGDYVSM